MLKTLGICRLDVFKRVLSVSLLASFLMVFVSSQAMAETKYVRVYDSYTNSYRYVPEQGVADKTRSLFRDPVVKQAAVGAAVGVAAGALSDRASVGKSAVVGAAVGAGTGLLDKSGYLDGKPMIKSAVKGAAIGTAASAVTDRSKLKGAAVGGAAGAGYHWLQNFLNR